MDDVLANRAAYDTATPEAPGIGARSTPAHVELRARSEAAQPSFGCRWAMNVADQSGRSVGML